MKKLIFAALAAVIIVPTYITAHNQSNVAPVSQNSGFSVVDECRVPVFHTDFAFPPQGGVVVRTESGSMYFIRTYLAGCEHAADGYPIVKGISTAQPVQPLHLTPTPIVTPAPTCN